MPINPFENAIVTEPRRIEPPIAGLNDAPLERLSDHLDSLVVGAPPRVHKSPGVRLVLSPAPGYGKSHLIGRLFQKLSGRATVVYIRPYVNAASCWKSILLKTVQEMEFPEGAQAEACATDQPSQLEAFIHGVIVDLAVEGIEAGAILAAENRRGGILRFLREADFYALRARRPWVDWVLRDRGHLAHLMDRRLKRAGIQLNASPVSWIRVLAAYAYRPQELELRQACLDWMKGASLDEEEAEAIGVTQADRPAHDLSIDQADALARERIVDLCALAGFFRPFVFCFDQTENYASAMELAGSLGLVFEGLTAECLNQLTIATANQDPWEKGVKPHWQEAHKHRVLEPPLELRGLNRPQAEALVRSRLDGWKADKERIGRMLDTAWLGGIFSQTPTIGVRDFLFLCSRRWEGSEGPAAQPGKKPASEAPQITAPSLEDLYTARLNRVKTQPKRLVFNPDALYWLVAKVGCREEALKPAPPAGSRYLAAAWDLGERRVYFGLEAGHHYKRWQAIAREAERLHAADPGSKAVFFRTPDLRPIPGARWKAAAEIEAAKGRSLHLLALSRAEMAALYAAHELFLDAVEGDIPAAPEQAVGYLRERLKGFWEKVMEPAADRWSVSGPSEPPAPQAPASSLVEKIRRIVQREKFLAVEDLLSRISPAITEDELHRARACIPEIQVHVGPTVTVLQWRKLR